MIPTSRLVAASIRATPSPPAATQTLSPATAAHREPGEADHRNHAVAGQVDAGHRTASGRRRPQAPAPTATSDGRKRSYRARSSNGSRPSLILATTRPVPGSSRTTSSVSGCTTQIVPGRRPPGRPGSAHRRGSGRRPGRRVDPHDLAISPRADPQAAGVGRSRATAVAQALELRCRPAVRRGSCWIGVGVVVGVGWRPSHRPVGAGDAPHDGEHRDRPEHGGTDSQFVTL